MMSIQIYLPLRPGAQVSFGAHVLFVFSISPYVTLVGRMTEDRAVLGTTGSAEQLLIKLSEDKHKTKNTETKVNTIKSKFL